MNFVQNFIWKITNYVNKYAKKEGDDLQILHYGMQVLFMNLFKLFLLFVTAYFLNIFLYTLTAFVCFGFIRTFASGVHCKNSIICIIANYIFFCGNAFLSILLKKHFQIIILSFAISIILLFFFSPAETKKRPINKKYYGLKLKTESIIAALILLIICIMIHNPIYINIISIAVLEESLCTTPLFYKLLY